MIRVPLNESNSRDGESIPPIILGEGRCISSSPNNLHSTRKLQQIGPFSKDLHRPPLSASSVNCSSVSVAILICSKEELCIR